MAFWFSCGAASAIALAMGKSIYQNEYDIRAYNTDILEEGDDNQRFLKDCENWIGIKIEQAKNNSILHNSAEQVWRDSKYMAGVRGARCTGTLKKQARYDLESRLYNEGTPIAWHVLGFTSEEKNRHDLFTKFERDNVMPVLINLGITKEMCWRILDEVGIELPLAYRQGYPNANCKGCVKATSPTYWNHVRKTDPDVFEARAKLSRTISKKGVRLVRYKGKRIFLDELPPDAKGQKMKSYECGIFCDLPKHAK